MRGWGAEACTAARASPRECVRVESSYSVHVSVSIQVLYVEHAPPQGLVNTAQSTHLAGNVTTTDSYTS